MNTILKNMWNNNWGLSQAYKFVLHKKLSFTKEQCVAFYKASYKLNGRYGSYTLVKKKYYSLKPSRNELISKYTVYTGMFGNYAQWLGLSVSHFLIQNGYEPLTERSKS